MIVAVSGSRRVLCYGVLRREFGELGLGPGDTVVHGACHLGGVDEAADAVARELGCEVRAYPVDHAVDGPWPAAGPRRNLRMLQESGAERLLALPCPRSRGTRSAVTAARKLGIPVRVVPVAKTDQ